MLSPRIDWGAFCAEIAVLHESGVPVLDALEDMCHDPDLGPLQDIARVALRRLRQGQNLAQAFAEAPPLVHSALESGERSGRLSTALLRAAEQWRWREQWRRDLLAALRYPAVVLLLLFGVLVAMVQVLLPAMQNLVELSGSEMGQSGRWLAALSEVSSAAWLAGGALLVLVFVGTVQGLYRGLFVSASQWSRLWGLRAWRDGLMATYYRQVGDLYASGVALIDAMESSLPKNGPLPLRQTLSDTTGALRRGHSLANALAPGFRHDEARRLRVAERSGTLEACWMELAQRAEARTRAALHELQAAMGPILSLLAGGLLLWIVMAVLWPLYGALGSFG